MPRFDLDLGKVAATADAWDHVARPRITEYTHKIELPVNEKFCSRVSIVTYLDGFQEIFVDGCEIGTAEVAEAVGRALIVAAQKSKEQTRSARMEP